MSDPLLIGARGWEVAGWVGDFYPGELPDDWRFCYYSNNLRSVLVPQEALAGAQRADIERWVEDSDPAFRFVLELPAALGAADAPARELAAFNELVEPLADRIAGWLLRLAAETPLRVDAFEERLHRLAQQAPLCVDLPAVLRSDAALLAVLDRQGVGLTWHCARESAPRPGGGLMVALAPVADARTVRHWIEKLAQWQGHHHAARAGLFFEPSGRSARAAQEARLIADLMGV
jgi:uncharacterized protein YecE (DUF72 family)